MNMVAYSDTLKNKGGAAARVFPAALGVLLLANCATGIQMSRTTPAQLSASAADGRSSSLHSGNHFAYWLWKEDDGTWHLRTTSARQEHRFQGRIHPMTAGSIEALVGVGLEGGGRRHRGDGMDMVEGDVVLDFRTKASEDGLDFQLRGNVCLEFDLRIDGDGAPGK